jgi:hypothetical protein
MWARNRQARIYDPNRSKFRSLLIRGAASAAPFFINSVMNYDVIFKLIADVGFPIAAALVAGVFVYFVINYILESVVKAIKGMQGIIMGLDNRVKTMNHDIIRVDAVVSSALGLKPDLDRIARADGKNDARKD